MTRAHHAGGPMPHHPGRRGTSGGTPLLGKSILQTPHPVLQLSDLKRGKCKEETGDLSVVTFC